MAEMDFHMDTMFSFCLFHWGQVFDYLQVKTVDSAEREVVECYITGTLWCGQISIDIVLGQWRIQGGYLGVHMPSLSTIVI